MRLGVLIFCLLGSGGCAVVAETTRSPPEKVLTSEEHLATHGANIRYWEPGPADIAKARLALQQAVKEKRLWEPALLARYFPDAALTFSPVYRDEERVVYILMWGGWRETGGPLRPNILIPDSPHFYRTVIFVVSHDKVYDRFPVPKP